MILRFEIEIDDGRVSKRTQGARGRSYCRKVEKEAREQLWKPRCETTVKWEKKSHITTTMKQTCTTEGQRAGWRQIWGRKLRKDKCVCGRAIADTGEQHNTRVTDQADFWALRAWELEVDET